MKFGIDTTVKKKNQHLVKENILLSSQNTGKTNHILFLMEYEPSKTSLATFTTFIKKHFPSAFYDWDIVNASKLETSPETIKKNIYRFYQDNSSDYTKYIRAGQTIVVPLGWAISAITKSPNITTADFQDYIFNKTYFYSPQIDRMVFPIYGLYYLLVKKGGFEFPADNSRMQLALWQFALIKDNFDKFKAQRDASRKRIIRLKSTEEITELFEKYKHPCKIAWDTETSGLEWYRDHPGCVTMAFDNTTGYFLPFSLIDKERLSSFLSNKYQIGANLKFDCHFLMGQGIKGTRIDSDVIALAHKLNEDRSNSLKSLAYYYTDYGGYNDELEAFKDKYKPKTYLDIPENILSKYATMDAILTFGIHEALQEQLTLQDKNFPPLLPNGWTMRKLYEKIVIPSLNTFLKIEQKGVCVNTAIWDKNSMYIDSKVLELKEQIRTSLGYVEDDSIGFSFSGEKDIDPDEKDELQSTKQLGELLESLKWPCLGRAKAGHYLTGDKQLVRWEQAGYKEAKLLGEMRSYLTLQKTFIGRVKSKEGWRYYVNKDLDGVQRLHPSYKTMMMGTLRNGCGNPNWQQLPASALDADKFKQVISSENIEERYLVTLDYAAFQIRLACLDIGDNNDPLFRAFLANPNLDLHSETGYSIFCQGNKISTEWITLQDGDVIKEGYAFEKLKVLRFNEGKKILEPAEITFGEVLENDKLILN